MSFFNSIKKAFGGSGDEEYDVFGQPTTFVNPFSKDKNVPGREHEEDDVKIAVDKQYYTQNAVENSIEYHGKNLFLLRYLFDRETKEIPLL